ncbi:MAG: AbrB/MazE/SpoVT family DNA-binding domain-containing protein [Nanoarchaeota archaeon]|nr:AbrB/MazE/SpoVT family DNA-binding domain-containing protein [Nanoarchaeota archaeon]
MSEIETTTTSPKGQVVIPQSIRESLGITAGTRFAVYGKKDTIIFRRISLPSKEDFEKLVDFGVKFAKEEGISYENVIKDD